MRLSKANRALVRKYRIKRATLTLTQTVGTFTKTTKTSVPCGSRTAPWQAGATPV